MARGGGGGAEELNSVVKDCHRKLRQAVKSGRSVDEVWQEHLKDEESLTVYSDAMRGLATGPWTESVSSDRISWCVQSCHEYLDHRLQQLLEKDIRRQSHDMPTELHSSLTPSSSLSVREIVEDSSLTPSSSLIPSSSLSVREIVEDSSLIPSSSPSVREPVEDSSLIPSSSPSVRELVEDSSLVPSSALSVRELVEDSSLIPSSSPSVRELVEGMRSRPLRLLDVGSCYNPFLSLSQFDVTAIDIAPAAETVQKVDFLNLKIIHPTSDTKVEISENEMVSESYDVVVFCLLLSYLPSTVQRLKCCVNAHQLLRSHGLLLVVSPDSSHQNRHADIMVQWKICLKTIGFHRWKYEKLTHLHCMAFRKTTPIRDDYSSCDHTLLSIPQDNNTSDDDNITT